MILLTVEKLQHIMPNARTTRVYAFVEPLNDAMMSWSISSPERAAMWLANIAHECTELNSLKESLYYSTPERLVVVWPSRFWVPSDKAPDKPANKRDAREYAKNPAKLAEFVYSGRMGNGPEGSGDASKYIGRGPPMLTGKTNYTRCALGIDQPVDMYPDLLLDPVIGADAAGWFWYANGCSAMADEGDFLSAVIAWNGGETGLAEREMYWKRAKEVIL